MVDCVDDVVAQHGVERDRGRGVHHECASCTRAVAGQIERAGRNGVGTLTESTHIAGRHVQRPDPT